LREIRGALFQCVGETAAQHPHARPDAAIRHRRSVAICRCDRIFVGLVNGTLHARQKSSPHLDGFGAERESGCHADTVDDSPGCDDRQFHAATNGLNQRESVHLGWTAERCALGALDDYAVDPGIFSAQRTVNT
jgi:hypothetical protein